MKPKRSAGRSPEPGSASRAGATPAAIPSERIIEIAEFRAGLRAFLSESEAISKRWALTPQRYLLLLFIKGAADGTEQLSLTALSRQLRLSRAAVTELCARAHEAGLIERRPAGDDRRVVHLH